jgi:uncharacterized protein
MSDSAIFVNCPTCRKAVSWQASSRWRPFCCKRCQLIDLGEWAAEEKRIAGKTLPIDNEFADEEQSCFFLNS